MMAVLLEVAVLLATLGAAQANSDPRTWSTCPNTDKATIQRDCSLCMRAGNPPAFWWIKKGETCTKH